MKMSGILISLAIAAVVAAPAAAQQSLGDVAGSIKLNRPEGGSVVIDQDSLKSTRSRVSVGAENDFFRDTLDACETETRALHDLLMETRLGEVFYRQEWRAEVQEVGLRLEEARRELALISVDRRYEEAYGLAEMGSATAAEALRILLGAIEGNRPVFSEARKLSEEAIRSFEAALKAIGAASQSEAAEETAPMINPIEANQVMTDYCRGRYEQGSDGFDSCIAEQRAAVDAIAGRSAPSAGIVSSSFNVIRNNCRFEWPDNYAEQNRCEQRRIAAKRSQ